MSRFDGTPAALTYGEALVEIARRVSWGHEHDMAEVIKAIEVEHGIYVMPEAETRSLELERLRRLAAEADAADAEKARESEIAALQARLGLTPGQADAVTEQGPPTTTDATASAN